MSTTAQLEVSLEGSQPVELYTFSIGGDSYEFTSAEDDITIGTTTYLSEQGLKRTSAKSGRDTRSQPLQVEVPADNAFASNWKIRPPGAPGSVRIIRIQRAETPSIGTTFALEFYGLVREVDFPRSGKIAILTVASIDQARNRTVPRYGFSALCNHFLYGPGCDVDPNSHKVNAAVTAESASSITVPGCGAFADQTFAGGYVKPLGVNDFRLILTQVGDVLTLQLPFKDPVLNATVDAFKGCDHVIDGDCQNTFNNVIEFGGFPFIPLVNPIESGIL